MGDLKKILVVEDEGIVAEDIFQSLRSMGYMVPKVVSSGVEAMKIIPRIRPDLVLMDIVLRGELNGIETSRQIREQYDIPVIYLTAYADRDTLEKAKKTEPYGYLLKPFDDRELRITIEMALYKHQMEHILREREAYFSTTLKSIIDGVITTDRNGCVTFMNPVAESLTGVPLGEAYLQPVEYIIRLLKTKTGEPVHPDFNQILQEGIYLSLCENCWLVSRSGDQISVENSGSPIRNSRGEIIGAVLVLQDITEKIRLDEEKERIRQELLQSQKMEAVGKLAGGIAHDFNTLLTAMRGFTDMALMRLDSKEPMHDELMQVKNAAQSAAELTRQLLIFSQKQPLEPKVLRLNEPITEILKMLGRLIGENIAIVTDLDPGLWSIMGDKATIEQILLNLAVNAREAMPSGGTLTIKTENVTFDESTIAGLEGAWAGKFACLSVADTGTGIPQDIRHRIFEPFFTTKGAGKGTGLGLSVVYGIVKEHNGWIHVYSEENKGTVFRIYLPAIHIKAKKEPQVRKSIQPVQYARKTVLVVEDQEGAREFTKRALTKMGFEVLAACNADEALRLFQQENNQVDMVLSDVELPDLTGIELMDQLIEKKPDLKVLLCSGYTDEKSRWPVIRERGFRFLQKPYGFTELMEIMNEFFIERKLTS
jgi:two-component system cell cycle sensor histidine kinase/response regulator CckA